MATDRLSTIAFGPVPSRRLGRSLGINNVPPKTCTYGCIYCQVGPSPTKEITARDFYPPEEVAAAVTVQVRAVTAAGDTIDYLTFVPDGEPTLDARLAQEIDLLQPLGIDIAVITNASLLWRPEVRETLRMADWVSVKVDSADETTWRRINHPHNQLGLDCVLDGISTFSREFSGVVATETMLVAGVNDATDSVERVSAFIADLGAATSYLAVPTRPPAVRGVRPPSSASLNRAFQVMSRHLDRVELLIGYEGDEFTPSGEATTDLLAICAVHPMRRSAIERLLTRTGEGWDTVEGLLADGRLVKADFEGHEYCLRRPARS